MRKNLLLLMMLLFIVAFSGVLTGEAALEKVQLEERTIQDPMKSWSITFTEAVNEGTIKKQNFYIIDARQKKVKAKLQLSDDGSKVTITPEAPYKEGVQYYLYIKGNVKSGSNEFLNEHTILPFKLAGRSSTGKGVDSKTGKENQNVSKGTNSGSQGNTGSSSGTGSSSSSSSNANNGKKPAKRILNVQANRHAHFVEISVEVSEHVVKVKAGNDEFEYKGNNQFTLYKPSLKSGEKLSIKGYSPSNKVLETKEIVIP
ncbi:Ig-like domain-containing protein [Bacillus sp. Bva_UNVM-123]|uniref:Ig-like domain-containing protein n=1 Tax=Bacillus sp. Bva_UNVM-123 TaxID=2829798 RepID=UPI00391F0281